MPDRERPRRYPPTVQGRLLAKKLRMLREASGLSLVQVVAQLWPGSDHTRLSRIERAESKVKDVDLLRMLNLYGVTDAAEQSSFLALAAAARQRNWYQKFGHLLSGPLYAYIALEQEATQLRTWSLGTIHGLLQTKEYAEATYRGATGTYVPELTQLVGARLQRQQQLRDGKAKLWAALDESVLHRPVGGRDVLRGQLEYLLNQPRSVTIQVVPWMQDWHTGLINAFTYMEFSELPAVAFLGSASGDQYLDREEEAQEFRETHMWLTRLAMEPAESLALIESIKNSL